eukprot:1094173-Pelagomonas_calceolata.AAC.8
MLHRSGNARYFKVEVANQGITMGMRKNSKKQIKGGCFRDQGMRAILEPCTDTDGFATYFFTLLLMSVSLSDTAPRTVIGVYDNPKEGRTELSHASSAQRSLGRQAARGRPWGPKQWLQQQQRLQLQTGLLRAAAALPGPAPTWKSRMHMHSVRQPGVIELNTQQHLRLQTAGTLCAAATLPAPALE